MRDATVPMPLGDFWGGVCRSGAVPFSPGDAVVSELCNMGYARGNCERYTESNAPDAVRFLVVQDQNDLVRITYAMERDHHPCGHGTLEFSRSDGNFSRGGSSGLLERQAAAYVQSYLRRRPVAA